MKRYVRSTSPFEPVIGFSRAVRAGNLVFVSGTAGRDADGVVRDAGVYGQARKAIENIARALEEAGASLADVVRTRIYLTDINQWEDLARAHREAFGANPPASTMIEVSRLAAGEMLVEIEADAVVETP